MSKNPAVFDERKLRHLNGRWIRELGTDELTRRLEEFTGRTGLRDAVEISEEKIQTLADFWPLVGFLFDGPADDPKAFQKVIASNGGVESLQGGARGAGARRAVHGRERRARAARGRRESRRQAGQGVPAGACRDRRDDGVAGDLRERRAARQG